MGAGRIKGLAWAAALCWLLAILGLLVASLRGIINDNSYFLRLYQNMDIEAQIGISPQDCARAMGAMVGYMEGRRESIQLTVTEYGQEVQMFNQQEIDHMVDVRALYQGFRLLGNIGLVFLALLLVFLWCRWPWLVGCIRRGWWIALGIFGVLLLLLGTYALVDFNDFWTRFHHVFFTNDLWLMDYATCRMIRICPLELFSGLIGRFTLLGLGGMGAVSLVVVLSKNRKYRREQRKA